MFKKGDRVLVMLPMGEIDVFVIGFVIDQQDWGRQNVVVTVTDPEGLAGLKLRVRSSLLERITEEDVSPDDAPTGTIP